MISFNAKKTYLQDITERGKRNLDVVVASLAASFFFPTIAPFAIGAGLIYLLTKQNSIPYKDPYQKIKHDLQPTIDYYKKDLEEKLQRYSIPLRNRIEITDKIIDLNRAKDLYYR